MKKVAVLGSTGSIGTQTLDVIRKNADKLQVVALVAFSQREKLLEQVGEFTPAFHALICEQGAGCLIDAVKDCDIAVVATKGITALECVLYCLDNGITVALANKEILVCAGSLVMKKAQKGQIVPIDSEHCAISQCLLGKSSNVNKILLTASGGPFWNISKSQLRSVDAQMALQHPNWNMGSKITIDSATMMNKTLEVLEAKWLFDISIENIKIVVHRQSIVHSMVEFSDGSVMGQFASPDMRLPIQVALLGNGRDLIIKPMNFDQLLTLTFEPCNFDKFPCAKLAYQVDSMYPLAATVMNAANDVCVESFLNGKLAFDEFYSVIMSVVEGLSKDFISQDVTLQNVCHCDKISRELTNKLINGGVC